MPENPQTRTVKVQVRHSPKCKDRKRGAEWRKCRCMKILRVYKGGGPGANRRVATKTRSWEEAEKQAQVLRDSWDPVKVELARLKADKESKQITIEEGVALYISDMIARLGDNGTVAMARSLLGHIDPETKAVEKDGHLFSWLARIPVATRPVHIADLTPAHVTQWRTAWKFGDYTAAQRWGMACAFFNFCEAQGWVQESPARRMRYLDYDRRNRTAIFSDKQYDAILKAVAQYSPENIHPITRAAWKERVTTFLELLRWSGMALIDAVQFKPDMVDSEGVLRYRRQKTGELATVALPTHVANLLRNVALEADSIGPDEPFRTKGYDAHSDTVRWRKRLMKLFVLAGIASVQTDTGKSRPAHPHMLRDTFAVWNLRHGVPLHSLAKMLGHSNPLTTARAYLPWVQELEKAVITEGRAALERAAATKPAQGAKVVNMRKR